jgi:hypothetical protein
MGRWAILNGLLGLIVLVLGLQIAWTWMRSVPMVDLTRSAPDDAAPAGEAAEGGTGDRPRSRRGGADRTPPQSPAVLVTAITAKDLFDPSRQKASEEVKVAAPKEAPPPPNLTLAGIRMVGRDREAFITDASAGNQQKRMRIGDEVGGYTVKTIDLTRVTLASTAGDVVTLALTVEKAGGAPKPGMPVAPRPGAPVPPGGAPVPPGMPPASPAAGVQPRPPRAPAGPGAAAVPPPPRAGRAGAKPPGAPAAPGAPGAPAVPNGPGTPGMPQLPAGVRERLEQLRNN